jgi:D-alanyl-D-alanine carboxypeptidase (penicillin-binding protein 5/6)
VALCALWSVLVSAEPPPLPAAPSLKVPIHILIEAASGQVLAEARADDHAAPASLTKIMAVYVIAHEIKEGNVKLEDQVTISENAWRMGGSQMFIEVGKQVAVKDLLLGIIVQSGNDASVALAEHVSGTEEAFAELMNQHAQRLSMRGSHFADVSGLDQPEHYTTARDLAILSAALIREYPEIYALFKVHEFTFNGIKQPNRNKLLYRDPTVDGIKTGFTDGAGYCLAASAVRNDMRLISVVMGAASEKERTAATQALLSYGFRAYETRRLYEADKPLAQARIWKGTAKAAALGLAENLYVTLPRNRYKDLKASMDLDPRLMAPLAKGGQGGVLKIRLGDQELLERPLVALEAVEQAPFYSRWIDDLWMLVE